MAEPKRTAIIGASPKPYRYSYMAANMLMDYGYEIVPISIKKGEILGIPILNIREEPSVDDIDTLTMYIGPQNQPQWYDYFIGLNPRRIIFNPGSENDELVRIATRNGIETLDACTLVMLRTGHY